MLPFCGYNMGDYFAHWLTHRRGHRRRASCRKLFYVNWFRKDADGKFLWPGFGENSRVLEWVFERVDGDADAVDTPIGLLPTPDALDTDGLDIGRSDLETLLVDRRRRMEAGRCPRSASTTGASATTSRRRSSTPSTCSSATCRTSDR